MFDYMTSLMPKSVCANDVTTAVDQGMMTSLMQCLMNNDCK